MRSLKKSIEIYLRKYAPCLEAQLDHFRSLPFRKTVEAAAMAEGQDGKMLKHQRRVGCEVLARGKDRLLKCLPEIESRADFEGVLLVVVRETKPVRRFGTLARYDTALRIGAKLNKLPTMVYLHAGTKRGAKLLGLGTTRDVLTMWEVSELCPDLQELEPHHIENFLCIFKSSFEDDGCEEDDCGFTSPVRSHAAC